MARVDGIRGVQATWAELEPPVLRFLLKVVLSVGAVVASPFVAAAFLFFLLEWPLPWILVPLAIAAVILVLALIGWAIVRAKIRGWRAQVERAATIEATFREPPT